MKYILEYKEFDNLTIEEQEIKDKAISDNTFMKAPNGIKTKLTEKQWLQVRTKNFINWFGDWLNDPDKASKVIDENGEPIVVYHGSQNPNIKFESNRPAYFTSDKETAESFADRSFMGEPLYDDEVPTIYDVYLFIDKPFIITTEDEYEKYFQDSYINVDNIKNDGFNGMIYDPEDGGDIYYVVFSSNQIKSATNNSG